MSLADYPNQLAVFCHNSCTKLMVDKRVWPIKRWRINENSLYVHKYIYANHIHGRYVCMYIRMYVYTPSMLVYTVYTVHCI